MLTPKNLFGVTPERYKEITEYLDTAYNSTETPEEVEAHIIAHFPAWTAEEILVAGCHLGLKAAHSNLARFVVLAAPECFDPKDGKFVDDLDYPPRLSRNQRKKPVGEITNAPPDAQPEKP